MCSHDGRSSPFLASTQPQPQPFTSLLVTAGSEYHLPVTAGSEYHLIEHFFQSYGLSQLTKATLFSKLT